MQLYRHLGAWLAKNLVIEDSPFDEELAQRWWQLLGLPPVWANRLAEVNLRWDGEHLRFNVAHLAPSEAAVVDPFQVAHQCLLHVWRFNKFSEGRWTSVSNSSRTLVASLSLGLDSIVGSVRSQESGSDYYLHGYTRFSEQLRRSICIASVMGHVADHMVEALLEDDRVCLRAAELREELADELAYANGLETSVFDRLAMCILGDPGRLASDARRASEAAQPEIPQDVCARKIQQLARLQYRPAMSQDAVKLLAHASWTTTAVEQGHASATLAHGCHPELNEDMVLARSALHSARSLLPDETEGLRQEPENARLQRLQRCVPSRTTGQNMFFKEAFERMQANSFTDDAVPQGAKEELLARTHAEWRTLPEEAKAYCKNQAAEHARQRAAMIARKLQEHTHQVALRRQRARQDQERDATGLWAHASVGTFL